MNASQHPTRSRSSRRTVAFWVSQPVIVIALVSLPWARAARLESPPQLPATQDRPLAVMPRHNDPNVVTDEQLAVVLEKLRPRLRKPRPKISVLDHALRLWGSSAEFADGRCLSGPEMQQVLLDHATYKKFWGRDARPLLHRQTHGVAVRTQEGNASASHVDHTLATLAEIGTPLDQRLVTPEGPAAVRDIFTQAVRNFSLNQKEVEWTALALALYAPRPRIWSSKEQQQITFDLLATRMMRERLGAGVCYGNHRLYTLAVLLQVDESHQILTPATAEAIRNQLSEATARLTYTQHFEGWWDANWADGEPLPPRQKFGDLSRRLLATGHALEWWAIAPVELLPPRPVLIRAGQWLVRQIEQSSDRTVDANYTFLSHVGRALALWRGDLPANLYLSNALSGDCSAPAETQHGER